MKAVLTKKMAAILPVLLIVASGCTSIQTITQSRPLLVAKDATYADLEFGLAATLYSALQQTDGLDTKLDSIDANCLWHRRISVTSTDEKQTRFTPALLQPFGVQVFIGKDGHWANAVFIGMRMETTNGNNQTVGYYYQNPEGTLLRAMWATGTAGTAIGEFMPIAGVVRAIRTVNTISTSTITQFNALGVIVGGKVCQIINMDCLGSKNPDGTAPLYAHVRSIWQGIRLYADETESSGWFSVETDVDKITVLMGFGANIGRNAIKTDQGWQISGARLPSSDNSVKNGQSTGGAQTKQVGQRSLLPPFAAELRGKNEVRILNPNSFSVEVGIRSSQGGKDFDVPANGRQSAQVPNGRYDIYFVYSDNPEALFQGDSYTLNNNGVEIHIVKVVNGNYGIRQVK